MDGVLISRVVSDYLGRYRSADDEDPDLFKITFFGPIVYCSGALLDRILPVGDLDIAVRCTSPVSVDPDAMQSIPNTFSSWF